MKVMGSRVLVKRLELPEMTEGGLYILGREYPQIGEVLAVGNGARDKKGERKPITDLKAGDMVRYKRDGLDTREVGSDTFVIDYANCLCGLRREKDGYRVWAVGDHVLIQRDAAEAAEGLLAIPDVAQLKPYEGSVIAVGKSADLKTGERVIFARNAGSEIKLEGRDHLVVKTADLLGAIS